MWRAESPAWSIAAVALLVGTIANVASPDRGEPVAEIAPPTASSVPGPSPSTSSSRSTAPSATPAPTPTPSETTPTAAPSETATPADGGSRFDAAELLLASLPVKGRAPKTGYDRDVQFGNGWIDVDRNGCDTRNDILARDLEAEVMEGPCKVLSGVLSDPYTGQVIQFVRGQGTSSEVQIDHVVALLNSWETGAQQLTPEQRLQFANDPLNLLAVDGRANGQKGAGDAATWLPPQRAYWCVYVATQVEVKAKHRLWVTSAERDAMLRVLSGC